MPLLSLANLAMPEADPIEQIDAAADAGYQAVGLCINPPDRLAAALVTDHARRRRVKQHLAARNMTVLDIEVFPLRPDVDVPALLPVLEAGADLGAAFVLVTGNDTDPVRLADNYGRLCDIATPLGLRPTLEFISYRPLSTIQETEACLRRAGRVGGGMCVDSLHLFRSGGTIADLLAVDPADIGYAQICDAASMAHASTFSEEQLLRESRTDRRLPGEGVLPLVEFLNALPPGMAISIEAPSEAHAHLTPHGRAAVAMQTTLAILAQSNVR